MTDTEPATRYDSESPREDAATKATREELKQTAISEKKNSKSKEAGEEEHGAGEDADKMQAAAATPEQSNDADDAATHSDILIEQIGSPKKKRAHDEVEQEDDDVHHQRSRSKVGDGSDDGDSALDVAVPSGGAAALPSAPNGGEPEKKRLRDKEEAEAAKTSKAPTTTAKEPPTTSTSAFASSGFAKLTSSTSPFGSLTATGAATAGKPSLFGSAASSSASPFGALGPGGKNATPASSSSAKPGSSPALASAPKLSFGGAAGAPSPFASVTGAAPGKLFGSTFGSGFGSGFGSSTGTSTFAATSTSTFSSSTASASTSLSAFSSSSRIGGSVFGSTLGSGPRLTSFAQPGSVFKSDKPAKPFGAPESDAEGSDHGGESDEDAEEEENGDDAGGKEEDGDAKEGDDPRSKAGGEEKKKPRLQRVVVNDGEMGEATLIQVRARMYYLDKDEGGWKERGAGMLKLNVPEACVEYNRDGNVIPASFDASMMGADDTEEADEPEDKASEDDVDLESGDATKKGRAASATGAAAPPTRSVVRLIMRQDSTHRVILNTVILAATEFQERQTLKANTILFTAFEGAEAKPVSIQMKMSAVNSKAFMSAMDSVQRELRGQ